MNLALYTSRVSSSELFGIEGGSSSFTNSPQRGPSGFIGNCRQEFRLCRCNERGGREPRFNNVQSLLQLSDLTPIIVDHTHCAGIDTASRESIAIAFEATI